MSLYPILGHPLLRCPAGVSPAALEAHARIAERVLGLVGTVYTGSDAVEAAGFVAMQVNTQIEFIERQGGLKSETHGIETWVYSGEVPINALALAGANALAEVEEEATVGTFAAITSFR